MALETHRRKASTQSESLNLTASQITEETDKTDDYRHSDESPQQDTKGNFEFSNI